MATDPTGTLQRDTNSPVLALAHEAPALEVQPTTPQLNPEERYLEAVRGQGWISRSQARSRSKITNAGVAQPLEEQLLRLGHIESSTDGKKIREKPKALTFTPHAAGSAGANQ